MADNSARIGYLDELKGVAVFLVVLGHLVTARQEYHWIYNFIYSFHMPLFMFVSGVTTALSFRRRISFGQTASRRAGVLTAGRYLGQRFINIMIPYLCWGIFLPLVSALVYGGKVDWGEEFQNMFVDNRLYWFLPTLYGLIVSYMLYALLEELIFGKTGGALATWKNGLLVQAAVWCIVAVVFLTLYLVTGYQLFRDMIGYMIPFSLAALYVENAWVGELFCAKSMLPVCAVLYAALLPRFDFDQASVLTSLLRMMLGMCMTVLLLYLFSHAGLPVFVRKILAFWGRYTLLIYILQGVMIRWCGNLENMVAGKGALLGLYCLISAAVCSLCGVMAKVVQSVPVVRTLFLGRSK